MALNLRIVLSSLMAGILFNAGQARFVESATPSPNLDSLSDGTYQLCSEPKPERFDGAGVCLVAIKKGNRIDGYYGYPHSDGFVCLRGAVQGNRVKGEAYFALWESDRDYEIPSSAFHWDQENRLLLNDSQLIRFAGSRDRHVDWVRFKQASLNVSDFYRYKKVQMSAPRQLCDWQFR